MVQWKELVADAAGRLAEAGVPDPEVSARWIGQEATGSDGADWLEMVEQDATKRQLAGFDKMVERRLSGEPLQYVLGNWGFRSLDLFVDRRVLIPRPETEVVAQVAIEELQRLGRERGDDQGLTAVDLGTGSGAIGLSLAVEVPGTEVWLTDASADALAVARANLAGLGRSGGTVRIAAGSWFEALAPELAGLVDLVVSNPPYVAAEEDLEEQVARWEPHEALLADGRGMAHLLHLVAESGRWLTARGALILEMAPDQVDELVATAEARFDQVEAIEDLAGRRRGLVARFPTDS